MEKEFARFMMLLLKATEGRGYQLFMHFGQRRGRLKWNDSISVELGGKYYKSSGKSLHDMANEVVWRIRNAQPSD